MTTLEIRVPDIGDFADVPVIDVLVGPGDVVRVEDPIVTLESAKATIDVPSPSAGVVASVAVKTGDTVSQGSVILMLDAEEPEGGVGAVIPAIVPAATVPPIAPPVATPAAAAGPVVELRVPDLGGFADVPIVEILVRPGDRIAVEAPLVSLESDKATIEVPASRAGVVREISVRIGDLVSEGSVLGSVTVDEDGVAVASSVAGPTPASAVSPPPFATEAASSGASAPVPAAIPALPNPGSAGEAAGAPSVTGRTVHASPAIRRFARELGATLVDVAGTGPSGRITREDVQRFVRDRLVRPAPPVAPVRVGIGTDLPPLPAIDFAKYGPIERVALPRLRRVAGANLHRNWLAIPHVTNNDVADVTDLEALRKRLNVERPGARVTLLAFAMLAAVVALREHRDVNASLDGETLVRKEYFHIGFAADTPNGLVVPVVRDVDRKGVFELASETAALAARARAGELTAADASGGTFTISSLGGIGGTSFTPIVNAPEVAILGLSRTAMQPVWDGAAFVPRLMLPLSLSYDHRVIDGALAARFNATLVAVLGDLRRALL